MKKSFLAILLLCNGILFSQTSNESTLKPFIEVVGTAETEIIPNEIYLNISIKERMEKGEKLTIQSLENSLRKHLLNVGISEKNLSISDVNAVLAKTGWWKEEILSVANYTLKVNGADKLKKLFEGFKKLKIHNVNITKATHSNIIELRKKNRIKAIKIAKEKADYLLNAIGEKTGKPMIVNEISKNNLSNFSNLNYQNQYSSNRIEKLNISNHWSNDKVIQFEKIKVASSIYVKFSIK